MYEAVNCLSQTACVGAGDGSAVKTLAANAGADALTWLPHPPDTRPVNIHASIHSVTLYS